MFRKPDFKGVFLPQIEIQDQPKKGYICIASADIPIGTLIERCITIKFELSALKQMYDFLGGRTIFQDYVFTKSGYAYFAMGYGMVYSHDNKPNAKWSITHHENGRDTVDFRAIRNIEKGEEITVSYISIPSLLWFEQDETSTASDSSPS